MLTQEAETKVGWAVAPSHELVSGITRRNLLIQACLTGKLAHTVPDSEHEQICGWWEPWRQIAWLLLYTMHSKWSSAFRKAVTLKCYTNVITIIMALFITSFLGVGHHWIAKDSESSVPSEAGLRLWQASFSTEQRHAPEQSTTSGR